MNKTPRDEAIAELGKLIRHIPVAMLTTCRPDGTFRSRPMVNVNHRFDGDLWFFTHESDPKVREIVENPTVNVSFVSPGDGMYVSISGTATKVRDPSRAKLLWRDEDCGKWFPQGPGDPDLALLKIDILYAEYWDETTSAMKAMGGLLRGVFTGERPQSLKHDTVQWKRGGA